MYLPFISRPEFDPSLQHVIVLFIEIALSSDFCGQFMYIQDFQEVIPLYGTHLLYTENQQFRMDVRTSRKMSIKTKVCSTCRIVKRIHNLKQWIEESQQERPLKFMIMTKIPQILPDQRVMLICLFMVSLARRKLTNIEAA